MTHVAGILSAAWDLLMMASPYILFGLFIAGLLRAFVSPRQIARHLGGNNLRSVGLAALSGVPLPLCSCGVVPTAIGLRQQGASKPATIAFLISTPESGIDSIAVTYALLGPFMAIIRPIAAFVTAFVAGAAQIVFGMERLSPVTSRQSPANMQLPATDDRRPTTKVSIFAQIKYGLRFSFLTLLGDISGWFLFGILLGGIINYAIPESWIQNYLGTGWQAMLVMLAVGIPLYICASASTPIAAALIAKGMSPGAALVFLLAGPATNLASLPVLTKFLGKRSVAIYLLAIAICSVAIGMLVNLAAGLFTINPIAAFHAHHPLPVQLHLATTIALILLIAYSRTAPYIRKMGN